MKILYVLPGLAPHGGVRIVIEHANRLHDRGHDAYVTSLDRQLNSTLPMSAHIIHPFEADAEEWDAVVATSGGIWDVVHREFKGAKRKYGFCQMQDHLFYFGDDRKLIEECYHVPIVPITISQWLKDWLHEIGHERVEMIPNGVNFDHFYPDPFVSEYLSVHKPIVLIEGRDLEFSEADGTPQYVPSEAKNTRDAHKVFDILVEKGYDLAKWGFTQDPNEARWAWDQFWVLPPQDVIRHIYSTVGNSGGFLLKTTQYEGRNCSVVEAMACQCPVVATDPKGNEDLIPGVTCMLSEYGNIESLVADSRYLLDNPSTREAHRQRAHEYVHENLNWDDIIPTLERILET